ncbi:hypothetical protein U0C82_16100 [Fulvimarina sp. 2208YS6-2-32]|uniref:DUF2513 domain-containing protein n=1 Tax=Fulvimarina uroteuthidis TaxID=3098149 RepID=A0ABU5I633_9HYPH|nr:hypothetical protein [Fulvimarina sp. 2208YS6-2-32]MDY8110666.1 hypothetical protein [Fulvimarina sp. 2208YS6-2-32]
MSSSHELIGRILSSLIAGGLRKQYLEPEEFECADPPKFYEFMDVMHWMVEERLIRVEGIEVDGLHRSVQLTSLGLKAAEDKAFDENESVREAVEKTPSGLSAEKYAKIGSFVGGLIGGMTKSIGG